MGKTFKDRRDKPYMGEDDISIYPFNNKIIKKRRLSKAEKRVLKDQEINERIEYIIKNGFN